MNTCTFTLRFEAALEREFIAEYQRNALPFIRGTAILGMLLFVTFGVLDSTFFPALKNQFWLLRLGIVCPVIGFSVALTFWPRYQHLWHLGVSLAVATTFAVTLYMEACAPAPFVYTIFVPTLMLILWYTFSALKLRFVNASIIGVGAVVGFQLVSVVFAKFPGDMLAISDFCMAATLLMGMLICYNNEQERRNEFLLRRENIDLVRRLSLERQNAESANTAKSRFLAAASHDLRQPMHALNMFTARLASLPHSAEDKELIGSIDSAAQAMSGLLDALLDISRLDAGEMEVHVTDFPASELLDHVGDAYSAIAREKGLILHIVPSTLWLRSDPLLLRRILVNFVSNALRYTLDGAVLVACRRRGDQVRIEVRDSGIGIPHQAHEIIFEEFVQLANPERDRTKGLGLGLAIVHRLAGLIGHRLSLRSAPGRGSVFAIEVGKGEARADDPSSTNPEWQMAFSLKGRTVVVIDDDEASCAGMTALISSWGCRVIGAANAALALQRCGDAEAVPDVVLSDYRLAGGHDGIDAIRALRLRYGANLPAALISGDTAPEVLTLARQTHLAMLTKPTPPARLRAMLNRLLTRIGED